MIEGWICKPLSEITTKIGSGATPRGGKKAYKPEGISLIRSLNVYDDGFKHKDLAKIDDTQADALSNVIIKQDDVLLNITGASIARCCIPPSDVLPARVNQHVSIIRPCKHIIDPRFLHYLLISWDYKKLLLATGEDGGSTRQALTKAQLQEFMVEFPESLPEQQRIVAILDQAFEGIATAKANAEKNLQSARELFESHLNAVFTQHGDGWIKKKLNEVCEGKITDGTHQTPKYFNDGFIFLSSKNVTSGQIDWEDIKFVDESQHNSMQKRLSPQLNDILLAKNGTTGVAAIVDKDVAFDIYVSLALLRPSANILPRYLWHFINSPVAKRQFNARLKGVGVPNLHLNEIREVVILLPQKKEHQQEVVDRLDSLLSAKQNLEKILQQKLAALDELKQSLLHKAFAGEL